MTLRLEWTWRRMVVAVVVLGVLVVAVTATVRYVTAPVLSAQDVQVLETRSAAVSPGEQAAALDPGLREAFTTAGQPLLPAGSTMDVDEDSFTSTGDGFAEADALVSGPQPGRWRLLLIEQASGEWRIYSTVAQP